jgi:alpha-tubulin suppressor-like RCC1 family protein
VEATKLNNLGLNIVSAAAGAEFSIILTDEGKLYRYASFVMTNFFSWGNGQSGQLGHGNCEDSLQPKRIKALENVYIKRIVVSRCNCYAQSDDQIFVWGANKNGELGLGDSIMRTLPEPLKNFDEILPLVIAGGQRTFILSV